MKSIDNYILEKFKINSKTANKTKEIHREFNTDALTTDISPKEMDTLEEYLQQLKVVPFVMSNQTFWADKLYSEKRNIYVYFDEKWNKEDQKTYLVFKKDQDNEWFVEVLINNKFKFLKDQYGNYLSSKDIEELCKQFLEKVPEEFYQNLKK